MASPPFVNLNTAVKSVFRDYPRIYFACHRRHTRDPATGELLSANQISVLDHLDAVDPTNLTALAAHMGVTPSTMSIAVGRLVRQGYITRVLDTADRRRIELRLTDAGVRVRGAHSVLDPKLVSDMLVQLGDDDRHAALLGLSLLARAADGAQQSRTVARARGA
ncbi:MAG: MarR family winged helix-turn-helix transcriptional regulator [Gemmatimonadaceae bacterium]